MKITEYKKKTELSYIAQAYLGVDKPTGKRLELQLRQNKNRR